MSNDLGPRYGYLTSIHGIIIKYQVRAEPDPHGNQALRLQSSVLLYLPSLHLE